WYRNEFNYNVTSTFYDNLFDNAYSSALKQYSVLANLSNEEYPYYKAIGNIMEAYHFQILVDLYGDIPYTEALKRGQNATPAYDDAEEVYNNLLDQLTQAVSVIDSSMSANAIKEVGDDDTIFKGDMLKWKQFAHSLKARILARYSDVADQSLINEELSKIQSSGGG